MFFGIVEPKKLYLSIMKHSLKERGGRTWSRVYDVTSVFMSTFLTAAARVAQVLIRAAQRSLCCAQVGQIAHQRVAREKLSCGVLGLGFTSVTSASVEPPSLTSTIQAASFVVFGTLTWVGKLTFLFHF